MVSSRRRRGIRRASLLGIWLLVRALGVDPVLAGQAAGPVTFAAEIDGRSLAEATESRPIRLRPHRPAEVSLRVTNGSSAPVDVRTVRLAGHVMGLTFFAYDTTVVLRVAPGATETRRYSLELGDLDGQATGLIPGSLTVLDSSGKELAGRRMVIDVRGSLRSVYGVFGLVVAGLTLVSFAVALVALARHTLPENRWRRALRFLTPGVGLGLSIVFTLSALRVFVPRPGRWIPILLISAGVLFAIGYFTPSPEGEIWDDGGDEPVAGRGAAGTGGSSRQR